MEATFPVPEWHRADLNERFRFFLKHTSHGLSWAPGQHAWDLARAEQAAEQGDWRFKWEIQSDADIGWMSGQERQDYESGLLQVQMVSIWHGREASPRRSAAGIVRYGFDPEVERVCEAELALLVGIDGDDHTGYTLRVTPWDGKDMRRDDADAIGELEKVG